MYTVITEVLHFACNVQWIKRLSDNMNSVIVLLFVHCLNLPRPEHLSVYIIMTRPATSVFKIPATFALWTVFVEAGKQQLLLYGT